MRVAIKLAMMVGMMLPVLFSRSLSAEDSVRSPTETVFGDLMDQAGEYRIRTPGGRELQLLPKPILYWSNPTRNQGQKGCLVLWTLDGRPWATGCLFTFVYQNQIRLKHAYHSLSNETLSAEYQGRTVWTPGSGVTWKTDATLGTPGRNERQRLVQMRAIARRFTGHLEDKKGATFQLELKPTPLYRYESSDEHVLDGAIFSFAIGTDPEILMLVEATASDNGPLSWRYAFARSHYCRVYMRNKDGQTVWEGLQQLELETVRLGDPSTMARSYVSYHVDRRIIEAP